jgi:hypothetical protein
LTGSFNTVPTFSFPSKDFALVVAVEHLSDGITVIDNIGLLKNKIIIKLGFPFLSILIISKLTLEGGEPKSSEEEVEMVD